MDQGSSRARGRGWPGFRAEPCPCMPLCQRSGLPGLGQLACVSLTGCFRCVLAQRATGTAAARSPCAQLAPPPCGALVPWVKAAPNIAIRNKHYMCCCCSRIKGIDQTRVFLFAVETLTLQRANQGARRGGASPPSSRRPRRVPPCVFVSSGIASPR